jgi:hypothetical protein
MTRYSVSLPEGPQLLRRMLTGSLQAHDRIRYGGFSCTWLAPSQGRPHRRLVVLAKLPPAQIGSYLSSLVALPASDAGS